MFSTYRRPTYPGNSQRVENQTPEHNKMTRPLERMIDDDALQHKQDEKIEIEKGISPYQIESNIPLPTARASLSAFYPFAQMQPLDSFFVPVPNRNQKTFTEQCGKITNLAHHYGAKHGWQMKTQRVKTGRSGVRIWRAA